MKIISLQAENVKKLVAVEIRPDGNLVEITGRNGQGKTSVLDSIWWALAGTKPIQSAPIRKGENEARIRLDLGEIIISRRFWRTKDGDEKTSIAVETVDGARYGSPQTMIDALLGELTFDPLAFARKDAKDQFNSLRRFAPDVDFEAIAKADKADRDQRTQKGRLADQERAAAQAITVPPDTQTEEEDENKLVEQLARAAQENADIDRRAANRVLVADEIRAARDVVARLDAEIVAAATEINARAQQQITRLAEQIATLQRQIAAVQKERDEEVGAAVQRLRDHADAAANSAQEQQAQLDAAGTLPEKTDVDGLRKKIENTRLSNAHVRRLIQRNRHLSTAERLDAEYKQLTAQIAKRQEDKLAAIAAAKIPVPGIEFGDGEVLLNGVPFDQASDAEQLTASVRIAIALNPKLRVIRIRDGSLLDEDAMTLLGQLADEHDMQVWVERVDSSGKIGFVLEDGHVRRAPDPAAQCIPDHAAKSDSSSAVPA